MSAPGESFGFMHRFLPPQEGDSSLTLFLLHGTGREETSLLDLGRHLAPAAGLLFDPEDLWARTHELADFVETAAQRYRVTSDRLFAAGFFNGANIAARVLLLRPHMLAGAVLFRPMMPLLPKTMAHLRGKPVFLAAGRTDPIVRPDETKGLQRLLLQAGADVTLHWEKAGHELTPMDIEAAREWLQDRAIARRDWTPGQGTKGDMLNLQEVDLVDRDAVRFLARCSADGIQFEHCPAYIREWIVREAKEGTP